MTPQGRLGRACSGSTRCSPAWSGTLGDNAHSLERRERPRATVEHDECGENLLTELVTLGWLEGVQERVGVVVQEKGRPEAVEDMSEQVLAALASFGLCEHLVGPVSSFGECCNMQRLERPEVSGRRLFSRLPEAKQLEN